MSITLLNLTFIGCPAKAVCCILFPFTFQEQPVQGMERAGSLLLSTSLLILIVPVHMLAKKRQFNSMNFCITITRLHLQTGPSLKRTKKTPVHKYPTFSLQHKEDSINLSTPERTAYGCIYQSVMTTIKHAEHSFIFLRFGSNENHTSFVGVKAVDQVTHLSNTIVMEVCNINIYLGKCKHLMKY